MIKLYYLLYQIKGNNINWIVDVDVKLNKDFIKVLDLNSDKEIYKIYKRYIKKKDIHKELKYKQFRIFNIGKFDKLISESLSE